MSQLKIKNGNNWESIPAGGIGVPSGGTTGQVLQKSSNTDYATEWGDLPGLDTLFSGSATNNQTVSLSGNIREYKLLICIGYMNNNSERIISVIVPVPAVTTTTTQFMSYISASSTSYYNIMKLQFPTDTSALYLTEQGNWQAPPLVAIYGLK